MNIGGPGRPVHRDDRVDLTSGRGVCLDADGSLDPPDPDGGRGRCHAGGDGERSALDRHFQRRRGFPDTQRPYVDGGSRQAQARPLDGVGRGTRDGPAVVVDHPLQDAASPRREGQIRPLGDPEQHLHRSQPGRGKRMHGELDEVGRHPCRDDHPLRVLGQDQLALEAELPLPGGLARSVVADPFEDVVVELSERHQAVLVSIGLAGREALDDGTGEDRRPGRGRVREVGPLERELHRVGSGDDDPTTSSAELLVLLLELVGHVDGPGRPRDHAALEGTAVAAVEEQHDSLRSASSHEPVHEGRVDRCR